MLEKGAIITWGDDFIACTRGELECRIDMDMNHIPDAAMTIATAALFAKGTNVLQYLQLAVKETDRLFAMAELRKGRQQKIIFVLRRLRR